MTKGKKNVLPPRIKPRAAGLNHQCSATEPWHPLATPHLTPFSPIFYSALGDYCYIGNNCRAFCCVFVRIWAVPQHGEPNGLALPGLKTHTDHIMKDNLDLYCTLLHIEGKKSGAARNQMQGFWLKTPMLCRLSFIRWSLSVFRLGQPRQFSSLCCDHSDFLNS